MIDRSPPRLLSPRSPPGYSRYFKNPGKTGRIYIRDEMALGPSLEETNLSFPFTQICQTELPFAEKKTRPIRPTMRPHDDDMIV